MAVRVVIAAALAAIVMFMWGFLYWGVLNVTEKIMDPLPREADVLAPLRAGQTPDGMYVYPGPMEAGGDAADQEAWEKKIKEGPILHMAFRRQGIEPMAPSMFIKALAHSFVIGLLSATLLAIVSPALQGYSRRVGVLFLVSVIAACGANVGAVIWWFHSVEYCAAQMVYEMVGGLLMALVIAAIVRTPRSQRITAAM
jgi:hypothetical protein